jgi:hypothetical protein
MVDTVSELVCPPVTSSLDRLIPPGEARFGDSSWLVATSLLSWDGTVADGIMSEGNDILSSSKDGRSAISGLLSAE